MLISYSSWGPRRSSREPQPSSISFLKLWKSHQCLEGSHGLGGWSTHGFLGREVSDMSREGKLGATGSRA